jgi:peptidoglycan/xylan/chitin deacetylase (PgdA/CDA1 family)
MAIQKTGPYPYVPIHKRPKLIWPNNARVALWVIPNIEVFPLNEHILANDHIPNVPAYSLRDYGARVGVWRMIEVLNRYKIPATVALNSEVCDQYPEIVEEAVRLNWEFMGHNETNTRRLNQILPEEEGQVISRVLKRIEEATGKKPVGWMGAGLQETWHTLEHLIHEECKYVADWMSDDQPYLMHVGDQTIAALNYSFEINDKLAFEDRNRTAEEFETMIRRQFDVLYREGADSGRVMAIALHPYLIGVPHRIDALDAALRYICSHEDVWLATGEEIIDHYLASLQ